jgi:hypothetical protein
MPPLKKAGAVVWPIEGGRIYEFSERSQGTELVPSAVSFLAVTVVVEPANAPIGAKATDQDCFS